MKTTDMIRKLEYFIRTSRRDKNLDDDSLPDWERGYDDCLDALEEEVNEFKEGVLDE